MKRRALVRVRDTDGSLRGVLVPVPPGGVDVEPRAVAEAVDRALDPIRRGPVRLCEDEDGRVTHF